jgi:hypothetical protein
LHRGAMVVSVLLLEVETVEQPLRTWIGVYPYPTSPRTPLFNYVRRTGGAMLYN